MKYKVGDRVRIKSIDWYNKNKNSNGDVVVLNKVPHFSWCENVRTVFTKDMAKFCGKVVTIEIVWTVNYSIVEGTHRDYFTDEMIEGLVEEKNNDCEKCGITRNSTRCLFMDSCPHNKQKNIIEIPENYVLKDENGNVINATKIVLEKKKKEYPQTYEECCKVMNYCCNTVATKTTHKEELIRRFQFLLLYRDAYWKIAGEEMGLGKPWEPDWENDTPYKFVVYNFKDKICCNVSLVKNHVLAFPTAEMRDAFYENFKELIESVKELL